MYPDHILLQALLIVQNQMQIIQLVQFQEIIQLMKQEDVLKVIVNHTQHAHVLIQQMILVL